MPPVVAAVVSVVSTALEFIGFNAFWAYVVAEIATYAAIIGGTYSYSRQQAKKALSALNSMQARALTVRDPVATRSIVYGRARVGGVMVYASTSGTGNKYLNIVVAHANHECDAVERFFLNNDEVFVDGSGVVTSATDQQGNSTTKYNGKVRVKIHLGAASQTYDTDLNAEVGSEWGSTCRLQGICYTYWRLEYDQNVFSGMPNVSVVLRGKKVYDPRSSTTAWSANAALCVRDYTDYVFKRSATLPSTPTGDTPSGWSDAPPAADGNPLWMSTGDKTSSGTLVGSWSTPVQTDGSGLVIEYSVDGSTSWHSTFTTGDLYARQKVFGGSFSAAYRIVGEQGATGATGPAGPTGPTGPQGPAGADGAAVTVLYGTSGAIGLNSGGQTTIASVSKTLTGANAQLALQIDCNESNGIADSGVTVRVYRDSTVIKVLGFPLAANGTNAQAVIISDSPGAGTYTYAVKAYRTQSTALVDCTVDGGITG